MSRKKALATTAMPNKDMQLITGEVLYLMRVGWRSHQKDQVLEGLEVAIEGSSPEDWARWTDLSLDRVIDDLHYLGTP